MNALQKLIEELEGVRSFFDASHIKMPDAVAALKEVDERLTALEKVVNK